MDNHAHSEAPTSAEMMAALQNRTEVVDAVLSSVEKTAGRLQRLGFDEKASARRAFELVGGVEFEGFYDDDDVHSAHN